MSLRSRARPYALPLAVAGAIGALAVTAIVERAGEPALPLDDAFIHLHYARRLAAGHWFSYAPGSGYSSGATSLVWPLVLAPFFVLGLDEFQSALRKSKCQNRRAHGVGGLGQGGPPMALESRRP